MAREFPEFQEQATQLPGVRQAPRPQHTALDLAGFKGLTTRLFERQLEKHHKEVVSDIKKAATVAQHEAGVSTIAQPGSKLTPTLQGEWDQAARAVHKAQLRADVANEIAALTREYRNDPDGFFSKSNAMREERVASLDEVDPEIAVSSDLYMQGEIGRAYQNLVEKQFHREMEAQTVDFVAGVEDEAQAINERVLNDPDYSSSNYQEDLHKLEEILYEGVKTHLLTPTEGQRMLRTLQSNLTENFVWQQYFRFKDARDWDSMQVLLNELEREGGYFPDPKMSRQLGAQLANRLRNKMVADESAAKEAAGRFHRRLLSGAKAARYGHEVMDEKGLAVARAELEAHAPYLTPKQIEDAAFAITKAVSWSEVHAVLESGSLVDMMGSMLTLQEFGIDDMDPGVRNRLESIIEERISHYVGYAESNDLAGAFDPINWAGSPSDILQALEKRRADMERVYGPAAQYASVWSQEDVREFRKLAREGIKNDPEAAVELLTTIASVIQEAYPWEAAGLASRLGDGAAYVYLPYISMLLGHESRTVLRMIRSGVLGANISDAELKKIDPGSSREVFNSKNLDLMGRTSKGWSLGDPALESEMRGFFLDVYAYLVLESGDGKEASRKMISYLEDLDQFTFLGNGAPIPTVMIPGESPIEKSQWIRAFNKIISDPEKVGLSADETLETQYLVPMRVNEEDFVIWHRSDNTLLVNHKTGEPIIIRGGEIADLALVTRPSVGAISTQRAKEVGAALLEVPEEVGSAATEGVEWFHMVPWLPFTPRVERGEARQLHRTLVKYSQYPDVQGRVGDYLVNDAMVDHAAERFPEGHDVLNFIERRIGDDPEALHAYGRIAEGWPNPYVLEQNRFIAFLYIEHLKNTIDDPKGVWAAYIVGEDEYWELVKEYGDEWMDALPLIARQLIFAMTKEAPELAPAASEEEADLIRKHFEGRDPMGMGD